MKKISDEFVISVGLLLVSFFIFQGAILPSMFKGVLSANVASAANPYGLTASKYAPGVFSFHYLFSSPVSGGQGVSFDLPIVPFNDKTLGRLDVLQQAGTLRDAWNYPVRENLFMKEGKDNGQAKSDNDANVAGLVNCRANTNVTGYFKAYFEDVAAHNAVGYDDPLHGQARRDRACQVLQDIGTLIELDQTTVTPDILFMVNPGGLPNGALAGASSYYGSETGDLDNGTLHKHIISHNDPTPGAGHFDAFVITNWDGIGWDVDSNLNIATYSLYTVLYHEIMHTLGFRGLLPAAIMTTNDSHEHGTFDANTFRDNTLANPFFNTLNENLQVPTGTPPAWFITNQVVYRGTKNIIGATPDAIDPVFSPGSWQQGSSLSHFDMTRSNGQVYVMNPSIPPNTVRSIHADEKNVLCHLGYQVLGVAGCQDPTPLAANDSALLTNNPICINPLANDQVFGNGTLSMHALVPIHIIVGDTILYYASANCSGAALPNVEGAQSVKFTPVADSSPRTMSYTIKNNVTHRISFPATISLLSCNNDPTNLVCNGDFEMGTLAPIIDTLTTNAYFICQANEYTPGGSNIPWWCHMAPSADVVSKISTFPTSWENFPWACGMFPGCLLNMNDSGNWAALLGVYEGAAEESIQTQLRTPLIAGHSYKISYDLLKGKFWQAMPASVSALVQVQNGAHFLSFGSTPILGQVISHPQVTASTNTWTHVEDTFIASDNFDFLSFGPQAPIEASIVYLDNISLREIPSNTGTNAIGGEVFQDMNTNGVIDGGDTGLSGIAVGLFHAGETIPFATATTSDIPALGHYHFDNLPNGDYRTALMGESTYSAITAPPTNALIPGYAHVRAASVTGGTQSLANDFGVALTNPVAQSDIYVRKYLTDSTLSANDRMVTFRIDVSNLGQANATNVDVSDIVASPFIYQTSATPLPNTYTPSSGIFHIPSLAVGSTVSLQLTLKVSNIACGQLQNTAHLASLDQIDVLTGNNQSTAILNVTNCLGVAPVKK